MAEIASKINPPALTSAPADAPAKPARAYPLGDAATRRSSSLFSAILLLVILSLLGGMLAMLARGGMDRWQSIVGSSEGLISVVFLAQVTIAVLCFALLVRWVRS